MLKLKEMRSFS